MSILEQPQVGSAYRQTYLNSIEHLIAQKRKEASDTRAQRAQAILADPETARKEYAAMIGWPLCGETKTMPTVKSVYVGISDFGAQTFRLQFEIFPDFWYYGLLFLHPDEVRPLCISQHGGNGTPEACSGLWGNTWNYNHMTERIYEQGLHVFAPQNLLWNIETAPVVLNRNDLDKNATLCDLRRRLDVQLKQLGGSIAALELYCLFRCLDYFETRPEVDDTNGFGMVGLSYGGSHTAMAAALDTRITAAISSCFFNDRYTHDWSDWVWKDAAHLFLDAEVALLTYPRRITYQIGSQDPLFQVEAGKTEFARIEAIAGRSLAPQITLEIFDGEHEFYARTPALKELAQLLMA